MSGAWYRHVIVDQDGEVEESPARDASQGRRIVQSLRRAGRTVWLLSAEEAEIWQRAIFNEEKERA